MTKPIRQPALNRNQALQRRTSLVTAHALFKARARAISQADPRICGYTELARTFGPGMVRMLARIAKAKKTPPAARVSAGLALLDRGYGRPPAFSTTNVVSSACR